MQWVYLLSFPSRHCHGGLRISFRTVYGALCTGSSCCPVSDMIIHLWAVQPLASFIVWNVLVLLPIFKVGNVSPSPASFLIVLPSLFLASWSSWAPHPHPLLTAFPFFLTLLMVFASLPSSAPQLSEEREGREQKSPLRHWAESLVITFPFISFCCLPKHRSVQSHACLACCRAFVGIRQVMKHSPFINKHLFVFIVGFVSDVWMSSLNVCL